MSAPIDDGPHVDGKLTRLTIGPRDELANPRPICRACSADMAKRTGLPAAVPVKSALVVRDTATGRYRAHVKCHGETDTIDLGDNPDELAVASAGAFKKGR